jgi:hypothetical protein
MCLLGLRRWGRSHVKPKHADIGDKKSGWLGGLLLKDLHKI